MPALAVSLPSSCSPMARYFAATSIGAEAHHRRRSGVQHRDDRLSGNPHRSVVLPADRHADLSAHRQRRHQSGRRRVRQVFAAGLVIRDLPLLASNWRSSQDLSDYLQRENVVAIADIDTRKLTRILRDKGAQNGCLMAGRGGRGAALEAGARLSRAGGHGSREGRELHEALRLERDRVGAGQRLRHAGRAEAITSSPTTTASSTTSCACSRAAAAS